MDYFILISRGCFSVFFLAVDPKTAHGLPTLQSEKNTLADMMLLLSIHAKLSLKYTNHCVRSTVVTDLKEAGFSNHEVCAVTGHRSEMSVQSYNRLDRAGSKRPKEMSSVLDGTSLANTL